MRLLKEENNFCSCCCDAVFRKAGLPSHYRTMEDRTMEEL